MFIPAVVTLVILAFVFYLFGPRQAMVTGGAFFLLYSAWSALAFFRVRNPNFLVSIAYLLSISAVFFSMAHAGPHAPLVRLFMIILVILFFWMVYIFATKRLKWRGREVFELAAQPVTRAENGFTERPLAAARAEYTRDEVRSFALFSLRHLIAWPYEENDRIILVPIMMGQEWAYLYGLVPPHEGRSWVSFDRDGHVSVSISKDMYLEFKEDLTFDQLCASLAHLFIEFLDLHRKGNGVRILDRMNALKIGPVH